MKNGVSIILVMLLVVFPLVSYFFLKGGLNFFQKTYDEITPKGELPPTLLEAVDTQGRVLRIPEDSVYLITMAMVYAGEENENFRRIDTMAHNLNHAFNADRSGLQKPLDFFLFVNEELMPLADSLLGKRPYIRLAPSSMSELRTLGINLGILTRESDPRNFMVLSDQVGRVRQVYLSFDPPTQREVYKHASILIPAPIKKDIIFEREKEL